MLAAAICLPGAHVRSFGDAPLVSRCAAATCEAGLAEQLTVAAVYDMYNMILCKCLCFCGTVLVHLEGDQLGTKCS